MPELPPAAERVAAREAPRRIAMPTPRVARLLKYLAELEYDKPLDRVELLTVCEMAEILGVTQESVSRILATFKRRAILQKQ